MSATSTFPLISLKKIGKTYRNGVIALDGVTTNIERGSFVSLVGPSGCGKSTLLRIIAGLSTPDRGELSWPSMSNERPADIGFVFQDPTLMPWASVADNVWLPLKLDGTSRTEALPRIMSMLERVGLADFANAYPRELSGGMKMRVSIARALITDPPLLLMDEPFAALDEFTREKLDDDILELWENQQLTVIFVTHSIYESAYLSQRVLIMAPRPGRIVSEIEIEEALPRSHAFRASPAYAEYCSRISTALRRGVVA